MYQQKDDQKMNFITLDFETYYADDYSLRKMTTEEYVRDERFEIIGVSVQVNEGEPVWLSGTLEDLKRYLKKNYDWDNAGVLAHNTLFDGAIMSWILDIHPKVWLDTISMARGLLGVNSRVSLAYLSEYYDLGVKGTEVVRAKNMRRADFSPEELSAYGDYCNQDVTLTQRLFKRLMAEGFPKPELKVIDLTLRMFIEPVLSLNTLKLEAHKQGLAKIKEQILEDIGLERTELMSNNLFADLLRKAGIEPPTKISKTTGKETYAFAKTDQAFTDLEDHPNMRVASLVSARLGTKSTLEQTRTERFIGIASRGLMPVPIKYYAAHTGRWGWHG